MRIAILHRYPEKDIKATNAAFPYLVEELRKFHTVDVLTFKKFDRFHGKLGKSLLWFFYVLWVVDDSYDVIYCDDSFPFYALAAWWMAPHAKIIKRMGDFHLMYYFNGLVYKILHWFERWEWRVCDMLIPVSEAMKLFFVNDGEMEVWSRARVVLDPVNLDDFHYVPNVDPPQFDVMFHGYLNKNKGVEMLIEAAGQLPHLKFYIVGDGPATEDLMLQALASGNVAFSGWVEYENMKYHIGQTKVGVAIRSKNPGNEFVYTQPFLQYWAAGRPVVVSKRLCLKDYPWTFDSVDELVFMIQKVLACGDKYRYPIERHDARVIAKQLEDLCVKTE